MKKFFVIIVAVFAQLMLISSAWAQATNSNALSDHRVRQALCMAIDMDTIAETLFEGQVIPADSLLPNGPMKAPGLPDYSYNPDKARALLAEANWDSERVLDMVFYYGDQLTTDLMAAIQAYFSDVGVKMTYRLLQGDVGAQLNSIPEDGVNGPAAVDYDLGYGARAAMVMQEYYNSFKTGSNPQTPGDANMDALVAKINASADPEVLKPAFFEIQQYQMDKVNICPLYYQKLFIYESDKVDRNGGAYGNAQYNYNWNLTNWKVSGGTMQTNTGPVEFFESPFYNLGLWIHNKVVFDRLLMADGGMQPIGTSMAESYEMSSDGMNLTFKLKDNLTFHDGAPLTVKDVAFSIKTAMSTAQVHSLVLNTVSSIKGAEAFQSGSTTDVSGIKYSIADREISLEFSKLDPNVLTTFTQFAILPEHLLGGVDVNAFQQSSFWQNPIGSGAFKLEEVKMNDFAKFVPFDNYHGGKAGFDIIAYPSYDGDGNLIKNAAAGKMDYGFTKNVADVAALDAMSNMMTKAVDIPYTRMMWIMQYPKP
jgi:peptide/nickel transport system substrate-binding protein